MKKSKNDSQISDLRDKEFPHLYQNRGYKFREKMLSSIWFFKEHAQ